LFVQSAAAWPDMKNGFDDLIAQYPVPWNLNAYAYFACQANDWGTARQVLDKIGVNLDFNAWGDGGESDYNACADRVFTK
jgi:hypothetical protein